jgi:hypothetical protein
MVGEEGAEFVGAARQRQKDVGHEAGLFLHRRDALRDVPGKVLEPRRLETADQGVAHGATPLLSGAHAIIAPARLQKSAASF